MAEAKTQKTGADAVAFLDRISDPERRSDCEAIAAMMRSATKSEPRMWGPSIIGFGDRHYKYESGREGDTFVVGFSPRKNDLTLYLGEILEGQGPLLQKLGKCRTGKSCLHLKRMAEVDHKILEQLIAASVKAAR